MGKKRNVYHTTPTTITSLTDGKPVTFHPQDEPVTKDPELTAAYAAAEEHAEYERKREAQEEQERIQRDKENAAMAAKEAKMNEETAKYIANLG